MGLMVFNFTGDTHGFLQLGSHKSVFFFLLNYVTFLVIGALGFPLCKMGNSLFDTVYDFPILQVWILQVGAVCYWSS